MSVNKIKIKETIDLTLTGENVAKNLAIICKEFKDSRSSRPVESHEEDLAEDILRALGEY